MLLLCTSLQTFFVFFFNLKFKLYSSRHIRWKNMNCWEFSLFVILNLSYSCTILLCSSLFLLHCTFNSLYFLVLCFVLCDNWFCVINRKALMLQCCNLWFLFLFLFCNFCFKHRNIFECSCSWTTLKVIFIIFAYYLLNIICA